LILSLFELSEVRRTIVPATGPVIATSKDAIDAFIIPVLTTGYSVPPAFSLVRDNFPAWYRFREKIVKRLLHNRIQFMGGHLEGYGDPEGNNEKEQADPELDPQDEEERCPQEGHKDKQVQEEQGPGLTGISHFNKRNHRVDGGKSGDQDTELEYLATLQEEYCPEHSSEKDQEEEYPCPVFLKYIFDTHS